MSILLTPQLFNNELRTIQPQNFGRIKSSQPEPQFYWFLLKKKSVGLEPGFLPKKCVIMQDNHSSSVICVDVLC